MESEGVFAPKEVASPSYIYLKPTFKKALDFPSLPNYDCVAMISLVIS